MNDFAVRCMHFEECNNKMEEKARGVGAFYRKLIARGWEWIPQHADPTIGWHCPAHLYAEAQSLNGVTV